MHLTHHSVQRMEQRGIRPEEIDFVLRFGTETYRTGVRFVFLGRRDLPAAYVRTHGHLEGVTVVQCPFKGTIITCYRNRSAIADIRRKAKRSAKPRRLAA